MTKIEIEKEELDFLLSITGADYLTDKENKDLKKEVSKWKGSYNAKIKRDKNRDEVDKLSGLNDDLEDLK